MLKHGGRLEGKIEKMLEVEEVEKWRKFEGER